METGMKDWKKKGILFLVSQNISLFGSSVVSFAITWYVTLETSSGMWMTASILCNMLPQIVPVDKLTRMNGLNQT